MSNNTNNAPAANDSGSGNSALSGFSTSAFNFPSTAGLSTAFLGDDALQLLQSGDSVANFNHNNGSSNTAPTKMTSAATASSSKPNDNSAAAASSSKPNNNSAANSSNTCNNNLDALLQMMGMGGGGGDDYYDAPPPPPPPPFEDDAHYNDDDAVNFLESNASNTSNNSNSTSSKKTAGGGEQLLSTAVDPFAAADVQFEFRFDGKNNKNNNNSNNSNNSNARRVTVIDDAADDDNINLLTRGDKKPLAASSTVSSFQPSYNSHLFLDLPPIDGSNSMMIRGDNGIVRWVRSGGGGGGGGVDKSEQHHNDTHASHVLAVLRQQNEHGSGSIHKKMKKKDGAPRLIATADGGYEVADDDDDDNAINIVSSSDMLEDDNNDEDEDEDDNFEALTAMLNTFNATENHHTFSPTTMMLTSAAAANSLNSSSYDTHYSSASHSTSSSSLMSLKGIDVEALTREAAVRAERIRRELQSTAEKKEERQKLKEAHVEKGNDAAEEAAAYLTGGGGGPSSGGALLESADGLPDYNSLNKHAAAKNKIGHEGKGGKDDDHHTRRHHHHSALAASRADAALWTAKYAPKPFGELLSDEESNLALLQWMKSWDKFVFRPRTVLDNTNNTNTTNNDAAVTEGSDNASSPEAANKKKLNDIMAKGGGGKKGGADANKDANKDPLPDRPTQRIILITGPPGAGKTTMAHIIAAHCGYEAVEVNASVDRSIKDLERLIQTSVSDRHFLGANHHHHHGNNSKKGFHSATSASLAGPKRDRNDDEVNTDGGSTHKKKSIVTSMMEKPRCLIMDEMDGVLSSVTAALLKQDISRPVICLANDLYAPSLRDLRARSAPLLLSGGQVNVFNTMPVGLMQLPPIRPQRLLARLQIILRKQEDEDEVRYRRKMIAEAVRKATNNTQIEDFKGGGVGGKSAAAAAAVGSSSAFSGTLFPKKYKTPLADLIGQPLLAELVHVSNGDVRTCLNTLQFLCTSILTGSSSSHADADTADEKSSSRNKNNTSTSTSNTNNNGPITNISTAELHRLFKDACQKDTVMSTWSVWQHLFLRVEKAKYIQMLEKEIATQQQNNQQAASAAMNNTSNSNASSAAAPPPPPPPTSDADLYRSYLAREDARKAAAKLEVLRQQQRDREVAEEERLRVYGGGGGTKPTSAQLNDKPSTTAISTNNTTPTTIPPPQQQQQLSSTFATHADPGFAYLVNYVLPLSGSLSASNKSGAGGGASSIAGGVVDIDLVLEGCFEQWPRQRFPDYNLAKTRFCAATFSFHDVIASLAFGGGGMGGAGSGLLIHLSEQYAMLTAATCFACASSLSKADNKMVFPRTDSNYRSCLRNGLAVIKGFLESVEGGGGSGGGEKSSSSSSTSSSSSLITKQRLLSSSCFALHCPSVIAAEVAPYLCKCLFPQGSVKLPHHLSDISPRTLNLHDLQFFENTVVRRHVVYGLTYRAVKLPNSAMNANGNNNNAAGGTTTPGAPSSATDAPAPAPSRYAGGGGGNNENGLWALEPAIDRFCLLHLVNGGSRQQVFEKSQFSSSNSNFNNNGNSNNSKFGGGGGDNNGNGGSGWKKLSQVGLATNANFIIPPSLLEEYLASSMGKGGVHKSALASRYLLTIPPPPPPSSSSSTASTTAAGGNNANVSHHINSPVPRSNYVNALTASAGGGTNTGFGGGPSSSSSSAAYNPNNPVITRSLMISRGDVRQILVGSIKTAEIKMLNAMREEEKARRAREEEREKAKAEAAAAAIATQLKQQSNQQDGNTDENDDGNANGGGGFQFANAPLQPFDPSRPVKRTVLTFGNSNNNNGDTNKATTTTTTTTTTTASGGSIVTATATALSAAKELEQQHQKQIIELQKLAAAQQQPVKIKKDFFGRPIIPKDPSAAATAAATKKSLVGASKLNIAGDASDPSSSSATAAAAVIATDSLSKVREAEVLMAEKYPTMMKFCYYDGSTVGVKRAANWNDFM